MVRPPPGLPFIVSISGTSGAGKSSVIQIAAGLLGDVTLVHFDDYVTLGNDIAEIRAWVDAGADLALIRTPALAHDLSQLRAGHPIRHPRTGKAVAPTPVILLEEPFGRSRPELSALIDLAVFIEAPADVALARRVLREIESWQAEPAALAGALDLQMRAYLAAGRDAYLAAAEAARDSSDLVFDGMQPVEALARRLAAEIAQRQ
jgi:uridine kinase